MMWKYIYLMNQNVFNCEWYLKQTFFEWNIFLFVCLQFEKVCVRKLPKKSYAKNGYTQSISLTRENRENLFKCYFVVVTELLPFCWQNFEKQHRFKHHWTPYGIVLLTCYDSPIWCLFSSFAIDFPLAFRRT